VNLHLALKLQKLNCFHSSTKLFWISQFSLFYQVIPLLFALFQSKLPFYDAIFTLSSNSSWNLLSMSLEIPNSLAE